MLHTLSCLVKLSNIKCNQAKFRTNFDDFFTKHNCDMLLNIGFFFRSYFFSTQLVLPLIWLKLFQHYFWYLYNFLISPTFPLYKN